MNDIDPPYNFDGAFTEEQSKILAARKSPCAVFRYAGFEYDGEKIFVERIFKFIFTVTEVKAI